MFKRKPVKKCQIPECSKTLPKEPAIIYVGEFAFEVCEECEKLMEVIQQKTEEYYGRDESL